MDILGWAAVWISVSFGLASKVGKILKRNRLLSGDNWDEEWTK